ncbi:MAG: hypothetical protein MR215_03290 [Bacteroidales bacterium]|nr:hypothetical protein [Bacteroidales bacterium]
MRRWVVGMCMVTVAILATTALATGSRQDDGFSTDRMAFVEEMRLIFMQSADVKRGESAVAELQQLVNSGDDRMVNLLIEICNNIKKRKGKAFPDYITAIKTIGVMNQSQRISGQNFDVWEKVLEKKSKKLSSLKKYLDMTAAYAERGTVCSTSATQWNVPDGSKVHFVEADGDLNFKVDETTLRCISQGDSIDVVRTSGTVYTKTSKWLGDHGTITWERAGLDPEKVYASLGYFSIDMKTNGMEVNGCEFVNQNYFSEKLTGKVTYKCINRRTQYGLRYPRFETGEGQRMEIPELFKNVGYRGGFTQTGASFVGSGSVWLPAEVYIHYGDTVVATFSAAGFIMSTSSIESEKTEVDVKLGDEALTHPGLQFHYDDKQRTVSLIRGKKGIAQAKYRDSYHKVNIDTELLEWRIDGSKMYMKHVEGTPVNTVYVESQAYYSDEDFRKLWGMENTHPLQTVADFVRYNGGGGFPVRDFAEFNSMEIIQAQKLLLSLSYDGFVDYYVERDVCRATDRLYDYLKFSLGKKDYDEMRFLSVDSQSLQSYDDNKYILGKFTAGGRERLQKMLKDTTLTDTTRYDYNGFIDLENLDLKMRKVYGVQISDVDNLNIFLKPTDGNLTLKRNRDIEYNGIVTVGQVNAIGRNFYFNYDEFQIRMDSIDEMSLKMVDSTRMDRYGRYATPTLGNTLNDLSGLVQLNEPDNKSGKKKLPGYPRLSSTRPAKIYYDKNLIRGEDGRINIYDKELFYFSVDTFTFEDINNITNSNLPLNGVLTSNIFPEIRYPLRIREDYSLGFTMETPEEGLPIYGGKARFYKTIDLSNNGLRGIGDLTYSASKATSYAQTDSEGKVNGYETDDYFRFFLDHMEGNTRQFDVTKSTTAPKFPGVELGENQSKRDANNIPQPGKTQLKLFPEEDKMDVRNSVGKFQMYPKKDGDGFECEMNGKLTVTPNGLYGVGRTDMLGTTLEGRRIEFSDHVIKADTSYFASYTYENEERVLQSGELRQDIINKQDRRIYSRISALTRGKFVNDAIREDTVMNKISREDEDLGRKLIDRSMESIIDFDKREGYFQFIAAGGNEKEFTTVKYKTMVKNYTWDMERNIETIGTKGGPGNRFVCTKERGDSLNFLVPVAIYDRNTNTLKCEEVKSINVADAKVTLNAGDIVTIHKGAEMEPFYKVKVDLGTDSTSHSFANSSITIEGAKKYQGSGEYTFVDNEGGHNVIFMGDIHTDDAVTVARGTVYEDMPIDQHFSFKGDAALRGDRQLLEFDGGAKMRHNATHGPKGYIRFDAVLNPAKVRIPVDERSFGTTQGDAKNKADEIYHSFRIAKDSVHVYTTMLEHYKHVTDLKLIEAPQGLLYYNSIFGRFEINTPAKMAKPDTTGTFMSFYPDQDAIEAFGRIDLRAFLTKNPTGSFDIRSAGTIRHDRGKDLITSDLFTEMDFFMGPEISTMMYNDILSSKAPKCDSTSFKYQQRLAELYDTLSISAIRNELEGGMDPKTGLLPQFGPVFGFDNMSFTWSTGKKSYVCDTTVNLMMMHYRKVNRKVRIKCEILVRKNNGSRVRMLLTADDDTWYYLDFRGGSGRGYNRLSLKSSNPDFMQTLASIDIKERRSRSKNMEYVVAPDSYMDKFLENFGLDRVPEDAYAEAAAEDILEGIDLGTEESTPEETEEEAAEEAAAEEAASEEAENGEAEKGESSEASTEEDE